MSVPDSVRGSISLRREEADALLDRRSRDPFVFLGRRLAFCEKREWLVIRGLFTEASRVRVLDAQGHMEPADMSRLHDGPVFEFLGDDCWAYSGYRFQITGKDGCEWEILDPYSFWPFLSGFDLHLFAEGNLEKLYDKMGAHPLTVGDVSGVLFSVWAPNALGISVVGDFNRWDGRCHPMRCRGLNGVWELFIPGWVIGDTYKFEVRQSDGRLCQKSDPFAFHCENRPKTASLVTGISSRTWEDSDWMHRRRETDWMSEPISVYEVHLSSWARVPEEGNRMLSYEELAEKLVPYVKEMGFTHVELLPVMEHPLDESWGYQVTGYYAPTHRHGSPEGFAQLVQAFHRENVGVILDWVPGHFPKDDHGLARFDGTRLFEHEDPKKGDHPDWGTCVFNHGRNEVCNFLTSNALYWMERYHLDGLRVDAVASMLYANFSRRDGEWVPNAYGGVENIESIHFLEKLNVLCHGRHPGILTIAEESTSWPGVTRPVWAGGLGFSLKWNLGWMHDVLDFLAIDPIYRKHRMERLTFQLLYAFSENFMLVLSHDEVVHGKKSLLDKMAGDVWQKFANLRLLYALMYVFTGKKLLFMGGELGQWTEWRFAESLPWHLLDAEPHRGVQRLVKDLNRLYRQEPSLYKRDSTHRGFQWVDFSDMDNTVISFMRKAEGVARPVVCVFNLTPVPRFNYRVGVPFKTRYREVLNTDSCHYGGSNLGNWGEMEAHAVPAHGLPASVTLTLPPLAALVLVPDVPCA